MIAGDTIEGECSSRFDDQPKVCIGVLMHCSCVIDKLVVVASS